MTERRRNRPGGEGSAAPEEGGTALPDIAGRWCMSIAWQRGENTGDVDAIATIRHDLDGIRMEVQSKDSDSHTLLARYGRESSGGPVLHYMYEVEPKFLGVDNDGPYKGAAILRFYEEGEELRGNYWTSQLTKGHFTLRRWIQTDGLVTAPERIDVLLVTAIREEFDAAKAAFTALAPDRDGVHEWELCQEANAAHLAGTFFSDGRAAFTVRTLVDRLSETVL